MKPSLAATPDICLLLEGTYPYVSGGVSTWVHQMVTSMPDLRFSVFFIGSEKNSKAQYKYKLPSNLIGVDEVYMHEPEKKSGKRIPDPPPHVTDELMRLLRSFLLEKSAPEKEMAAIYGISREIVSLSRTLTFASVWNDSGTWELLSELYHRYAEGESFLDFFWSLRALIEPVWRLLEAVERIPPARMFHSLCTGYAGFIGGVAALNYESAYLLSEHGIYVRERVAEIQKARWLHDPPVLHPDLYRQPAMLRQVWIEFFKLLGRFAYQTANQITSLFDKNAQFASGFGADIRKIEVIPNGINVANFQPLRSKRTSALRLNPRRMNVGFMGRIVPIKDIKTLLKSARQVVNALPEVKFLIAGPFDEDTEYAHQCEALLQQLQLTNHVKFLGSKNRDDIMPEIDLMLLTSISEGLPFVILEAFAAGIPCVSTDVGACRELIEGRPAEMPSYGPAGIVAPVGNAEAIAEAIVRILKEPEAARNMGDAGRARAEAHYSGETVTQRYRQLYLCRPHDFARAGRTTTRAIMSQLSDNE